MPSAVTASVANEFNPLTNTDSKRGFRTVLGLSPFTTQFQPSTSQPRSALTAKTSAAKERRSVDISSSGTYFASLSYRKKKARVDRTSVTDASIFQRLGSSSSNTAIADANGLPSQQDARTLLAPTSLELDDCATTMVSQTMTKTMEVQQERASRKKLVRLEAQDGPWSISVAETPYDKKNYSIYIKSAYSLFCSFFMLGSG